VGTGPELRTDRLLLRRWREADREPFAALNADPVVMEHFPSPLTRAASDDFVDRVESRFDAEGWGLWAVEVVADPGGPSGFVGFTGLWAPDYEVPGSVGPDTVEVGWRLARWAWGHGYAPEAATAALRFAFDELGLDEVVSFTTVGNARSRRVMEKVGLRRRPERDFDHPRIDPAQHPHLVRHVLSAVTEAQWRGG
jgi:ribosomal-protein-alanine N-acetyltransferase